MSDIKCRNYQEEQELYRQGKLVGEPVFDHPIPPDASLSRLLRLVARYQQFRHDFPLTKWAAAIDELQAFPVQALTKAAQQHAEALREEAEELSFTPEGDLGVLLAAADWLDPKEEA